MAEGGNRKVFDMGVDEERICIAFDIVPSEIAAGGSVADDY